MSCDTRICFYNVLLIEKCSGDYWLIFVRRRERIILNRSACTCSKNGTATLAVGWSASHLFCIKNEFFPRCSLGPRCRIDGGQSYTIGRPGFQSFCRNLCLGCRRYFCAFGRVPRGWVFFPWQFVICATIHGCKLHRNVRLSRANNGRDKRNGHEKMNRLEKQRYHTAINSTSMAWLLRYYLAEHNYVSSRDTASFKESMFKSNHWSAHTCQIDCARRLRDTFFPPQK